MLQDAADAMGAGPAVDAGPGIDMGGIDLDVLATTDPETAAALRAMLEVDAKERAGTKGARSAATKLLCECSPARHDLSPIAPQTLLHVSRLTKSTFEPCWRQRYARTAGGSPIPIK